MMFFDVNTYSAPVDEIQALAANGVIGVFSAQDTPSAALGKRFGVPFMKSSRPTRCCKAERYKDSFSGAFYGPEQDMKQTFSFFIDKDVLSFLDTGRIVPPVLEQVYRHLPQGHRSTGTLLCAVLEVMIAGDSQYLLDMQEQIERLEEESLQTTAGDFNSKVMAVRKELLSRFCYYEQLADVCDKLTEDMDAFFNQYTLLAFGRLSERISRLLDQVKMLREYSIQVRELYQAQLDTRQNNIMKVLTIVTTIFFPLSLITSWYGMNFVNMPELKWHYGYLAVMLASVLVLAVCTLLFTRKKFWK